MTASKQRIGPWVGPTLVALFWGSAFVSIKFALSDFSPVLLVALRYGLASLGFLALYAARVIVFRPIASRDLPRFALLVALGVLVYHVSLAEAEIVLPASLASLIGQTTAVFALAFSALANPAILRPRTIAGIALASAGAFLVISGGHQVAGGRVPLVPVLVCFAAPFSLAAYTVLGKPLLARYGAANLTAQVGICGGAILATATAFMPGAWDELAAASLGSWLAVGSLALFSTVAGYTLWYQALARLSASQLAMFTYLVPVFGVLLSALTLGEAITSPTLCGGAVVIGGIGLANLPQRPAERRARTREGVSRSERAGRAFDRDAA